MKLLKLYLSWALVILLTPSISAQNWTQLDTISTYDVNLSYYMTTNGKVYMANNKAISKAQYDFYRDNWERTQACQPCEVYTYNDKHELKHIAIQYGECFVGPFKEFHSNGKVKVEGSFKTVDSQDWSNLRMRGLCSTRDGEWRFYAPDGKLVSIEHYEDGKVLQTETPKDSASEENSNVRSKIRDFFKKQ